MKPFAVKTLLLSAAIALPVSQANASPFAGSQSDDTNLEVGASVIPFGPHTAGKAGIGIGGDVFSKAMKVDFEGLASTTPTGHTGNPSTVYTFDEPITEDDHDGLGVFSFAQTSSGDVWYGEWSENGDTNFTARSVFYIGDKANTTMPTSGDADYSVKGFNHFSGSNQLSGNINVNFGTGVVDGDLENSDLQIEIDGSVSGSSFAGSATARDAANGYALLDSNGVSEGEFYGSNAAALAGMATFANNSQYDTSFGSTGKTTN